MAKVVIRTSRWQRIAMIEQSCKTIPTQWYTWAALWNVESEALSIIRYPFLLPPPPTLYIHNNAHSQHKHIKHTTTTNNYNTSLIHSLTHSLTRFAQTNRKPKYGMKVQ